MATSTLETSATTKKIKCPTVHYKPDPVEKMVALEWHGNKDVRVNTQRPKPMITDPQDVIVRITTSTVCGSDLHLYHKEFQGLETGDILGHEGVGIIESVGPEVKDLKVGDRVVVSAVISCGECEFCTEGKVSLCVNTNPNPQLDSMYGDRLSGIFGYSHLLGGFEGMQAEFVRVPIADRNCLKIPNTLTDDKAILLSDIACTGWHANELGEVTSGKTVAVWGCGPVGLMAVMWAKFRGASRVIALDDVPERLKIAQDLGAEVINISETKDVVKTLKELIPGGPDVGIEAAGFRYTHSILHKAERAILAETDTPEIITQIIKAVKKGGNVSLIGDYLAYANHFPIGALMEKSLTTRGGQVFVQKYWKQLMEYFVQGKVDPSFVVTDRFPLEQADQAYKVFDQKKEGTIKVLLTTKERR
jgi:threonine dehydrogenase-like Zn-dependent dehydrogenase